MLALAWMAVLTPPVPGQGDSFLHPGMEGYALLPDVEVTDIDYTKNFTVEAVIKIEANQGGGRWPFIVAKAEEYGGALAGAAGFVLGLELGQRQTYGQVVIAKVGDGTHQVVTRARERDGYVYGVMVWDVDNRALTLYVNGQREATDTNSLIVPAHIKTGMPLGLGQSGGYHPLGRDIYLARLWNRALSSAEIETLWDNFSSTGRHTLPVGFNFEALHSEWLMYETSDAWGRTGTTHVRDTAGLNHLKLQGGAVVQRGDGLLIPVHPTNGQSEVDKSICLMVSGGRDSLSGELVLPLHYWFQVDESPLFDSPALKESGWLTHDARWCPILKPDTVYYWHARARDSSDAPQTSDLTETITFTTEGPATWYVRPRNQQVSYGTEDGSSYENAFNGLVNWDDDLGNLPGIVWGPNGVEAGDTLYICGRHEVDFNDRAFSDQAVFNINASGYSSAYPVTLRGDYPSDPGTVIGFDSGYFVKIDRKHHLVLKNIVFEGFNLMTEPVANDGVDEVVTESPRSTYITFDGCTLTEAEHLVILNSEQDHWTFRNNSFLHGGVGIIVSARGDRGVRYLTVENNIFKDLGVPPYEDPDAHAVGGGAGEGDIIKGNYIENAGSAIEFWTSSLPMHNMTICYNFIRDIKKKRITEGHGIVVSGVNNDSVGRRTGFKIYGNIIVNAEGAGISSNNKDLVEVYNNVVADCSIGLRFAVQNAPLAARVYNNIVVDPCDYFVFAIADPNVPWNNVSWDHNLYWTNSGKMPLFDTVLAHDAGFSEYRRLQGWDRQGIMMDPRFVSLT